jgi:predicted ATPase
MSKKVNIPSKGDISLLRFEQIEIKNYKGIDSLKIDFAPPKFSDIPDVTVIGSPNGLGKTSILECCALLLLAIEDGNTLEFLSENLLHTFFEKDFSISGNFRKKGKVYSISLSYRKREERFEIEYESKPIIDIKKPRELDDPFSEQDIASVLGISSNPVLRNYFLFFSSYRKIQEGSPELGMLVRQSQMRLRPYSFRRNETVISSFKVEILRSIMLGNATLFDENDNADSKEILGKLNKLLNKYADVAIKKIAPYRDNTVDILLEHRKNKEIFSFDNLSSGQKEIISTFFLIWHLTYENPRIVLIDEPELHLNRDWQQTLVRDITRIAPNNQYIFATHSTEVAAGVEKYQRIKLQKEL